jgi:hypothetical protein
MLVFGSQASVMHLQLGLNITVFDASSYNVMYALQIMELLSLSLYVCVDIPASPVTVRGCWCLHHLPCTLLSQLSRPSWREGTWVTVALWGRLSL